MRPRVSLTQTGTESSVTVATAAAGFEEGTTEEPSKTSIIPPLSMDGSSNRNACVSPEMSGWSRDVSAVHPSTNCASPLLSLDTVLPPSLQCLTPLEQPEDANPSLLPRSLSQAHGVGEDSDDEGPAGMSAAQVEEQQLDTWCEGVARALRARRVPAATRTLVLQLLREGGEDQIGMARYGVY